MSEHHQMRRGAERFRLPPMYTAVTACRKSAGAGGEPKLRGHVYDISTSGVRIELDVPLDPGESVALVLDLPGTGSEVEASASVVWVNDSQDDPGPRRMALRFTEFARDADRDRLTHYLGTVTRRAA